MGCILQLLFIPSIQLRLFPAYIPPLFVSLSPIRIHKHTRILILFHSHFSVSWMQHRWYCKSLNLWLLIVATVAIRKSEIGSALTYVNVSPIIIACSILSYSIFILSPQCGLFLLFFETWRADILSSWCFYNWIVWSFFHILG